jgi:hypothetical protein
MLPVHIEHVLPDCDRDYLTSRYDSLQPPSTHNSQSDEDNNTHNDIPFQNVVITDVDGAAPANELRAAAVCHVKKKEEDTLRSTTIPPQ